MGTWSHTKNGSSKLRQADGSVFRVEISRLPVSHPKTFITTAMFPGLVFWHSITLKARFNSQVLVTAKWKLVYDERGCMKDGQDLSPIEQKANKFNMELLAEERSSPSVCATSRNNSNINLGPAWPPKVHFGKAFHMRGHFSDSINIDDWAVVDQL